MMRLRFLEVVQSVAKLELGLTLYCALIACLGSHEYKVL